MKQKQLIFCMGLSAIALFASCNEREIDLNPNGGSGSSSIGGSISLNLNADASFGAQTRALNESDYRNVSNYQVQVFNNDNPTTPIVDCKYSNLESEMPSSFAPGTYTVKAFYGTERPYSRNEFYVEGVKDNVVVNPGDEANVALTCLPTCGKISVAFDSKMATYYDQYDVSFSQAVAFSGSSIAWSANDNEPWYVHLNAGGETLRYTINLVAKEDYAYTDDKGNKKNEGTVTKEFSLERNRSYKLNIKPDYTAMTEGGLEIIIEIDDETNTPIDVPVVVPIEWL